jgi:hypothetical protein
MVLHYFRLVTMDSADGQRAGTRERPCLTERFIARGSLCIESLADLFGYRFEFVHRSSFGIDLKRKAPAVVVEDDLSAGGKKWWGKSSLPESLFRAVISLVLLAAL